MQCCKECLGTCNRQSATVPRLSRHMQETPRWCHPDHRSTCKRLTDSLRRCKDRLGTCRRFQNSLRRIEKLSGTVTDCLGVA
ncbi:hypothetical protein DPMN_075205 [Dreissena polymorpha]|uniref:Uncharacterized protein n=1 Tax=Dreissena polymorpha TaxID=45954 RepID=A0A9D4BMA6_DREPO|nr:hypothetical protein DPMN_075205 [Dreissena polymorpha]